MIQMDLTLGTELAYLEAKLTRAKPKIQKAIDRAVKKTARWLEVHTKRDLGKELKINQQALTFRYRKTFFPDTKAVSVWFGIDPFQARYIGRSRQNKRGVKAGSYQFDHAFIATMKNGHTNIFRRKKDTIKKVHLPISEPGSEIFQRYQVRAQARFSTILKQELNFIL